MVLGMVSTKPWCDIVKIDIEGALIQTPMQGGLTYIRQADDQVCGRVIYMLREDVVMDGCL